MVSARVPSHFTRSLQQNSVFFTSHMFRPFAGRHQAVLIKTYEYMEEITQSLQFSVLFTGVEITWPNIAYCRMYKLHTKQNIDKV